MAGIHADYAKWQYREGRRRDALIDVAHMLRLSPTRRGRLALGLLRDIAMGRAV
jgi:hypothetical protein